VPCSLRYISATSIFRAEGVQFVGRLCGLTTQNTAILRTQFFTSQLEWYMHDVTSSCVISFFVNITRLSQILSLFWVISLFVVTLDTWIYHGFSRVVQNFFEFLNINVRTCHHSTLLHTRSSSYASELVTVHTYTEMCCRFQVYGSLGEE
jgi:hypothetical protein